MCSPESVILALGELVSLLIWAPCVSPPKMFKAVQEPQSCLASQALLLPPSHSFDVQTSDNSLQPTRHFDLGCFVKHQSQGRVCPAQQALAGNSTWVQIMLLESCLWVDVSRHPLSGRRWQSASLALARSALPEPLQLSASRPHCFVQ